MRDLRTITAVVTGAGPGDAGRSSAWETFWLSAAITVTVLGSGYAIYSLWPSALDTVHTIYGLLTLEREA